VKLSYISAPVFLNFLSCFLDFGIFCFFKLTDLLIDQIKAPKCLGSVVGGPVPKTVQFPTSALACFITSRFSSSEAAVAAGQTD